MRHRRLRPLLLIGQVDGNLDVVRFLVQFNPKVLEIHCWEDAYIRSHCETVVSPSVEDPISGSISSQSSHPTLVHCSSRKPHIGVSRTSSVCISCGLIEDYQQGNHSKGHGIVGSLGGGLGFPLTSLRSDGKKERKGLGLGGSRNPKGLTTIRGILSPLFLSSTPQGWLEVGEKVP